MCMYCSVNYNVEQHTLLFVMAGLNSCSMPGYDVGYLVSVRMKLNEKREMCCKALGIKRTYQAFYSLLEASGFGDVTLRPGDP